MSGYLVQGTMGVGKQDKELLRKTNNQVTEAIKILRVPDLEELRST